MSHNDKTLEVKIQSTRGTKDFSFEKTAKVGEAIAKAVTAFDFAQGDKFSLVLATNTGEKLLPERTLVSYKIVDGTLLILTSMGGGV
jgi:hypothetical protein